MKNTSRLIALAGVGVLAFSACGSAPDAGDGKGGDKKSGGDFKACMVSDSGGWDDKSFNESGYKGLEAAKKDLGIETQTAESSAVTDFEPNINNLVGSDCDIIYTVGYLLAPATGKAAQANPDTGFAIIDSTAQDADGKPIEVKNVKPIEFNTSEAAFLAGYLAAGMSKTGKVATYGGMAIPTVTIFMDGFVDGVKKYNEDHGKNVQVLGWNKDTQAGSIVGSFEDQTKGKAVSDEFYKQGADIVMPVAGPVGAGTIAAAKEHKGAMVIWVDSDGFETNSSDKAAQDVILTSVMKMIGQSVQDVTKAASEGKFDNSPYVGTLENGGVGLAPFHNFEDKVPAELKTELEQIKKDIIDGKIVVESKAAPKGK